MEMASENQVTIVGNLTDDPELRYTTFGSVEGERQQRARRVVTARGHFHSSMLA